MKKIILLLILMTFSITGFAQEKGIYLGFSSGVGFTGFNYTLKGLESNGENIYQIGGNGTLTFSYFFNRHWGLTTGVGFSYYQSKGRYNTGFQDDLYYNLGNYQDDDAQGNIQDFELRARLGNWEEKQIGQFVEIPLMIAYQHKFGRKQKHGLYFGLGAKLQIPVDAKYKVLEGEYDSDLRLNISGFYGDEYPELGKPGAQPTTRHGFGSINNPHERYGWEGELQLKPSIAGAAEAGALFGISKRLDLTLGAYLDYGFNNIKDGGNDPLLVGPEEHYHPVGNDNIGEGITYNGFINSDRVSSVNLLSFGAKVGLRVKVGKLYNLETAEEMPVNLESKQGSEEFKSMGESLKIIAEAIIMGRNDSVVIIGNETKSNQQSTDERDEFGLTLEENFTLKERIFYDLRSSVLLPTSVIALDRKLEVLKRHPKLGLKIIGNTCTRGTEDINVPLGMNRAVSAQEYLIRRGVDPTRLQAETQSSYDPIVPNDTEQSRALNRRCDFEIIMIK